jgi:hypothetical protein
MGGSVDTLNHNLRLFWENELEELKLQEEIQDCIQDCTVIEEY